MKVRLVVVQGRPEGMEIPLPMPQFLIGRDSRCNLRPSSESISKLHCAILQRKGEVFVRDLKSTNGSFVNNDRIQGEVQVHDGDLLKVGPLVLAIKIHADEAVASTPTSGTADDQAVSWLLDYSPEGQHNREDLGTKTTIMDMSGESKPSDISKQKAEADTKVDEPTKKPDDPAKSKAVTADLAGDLLNKLLSPARKKKS